VKRISGVAKLGLGAVSDDMWKFAVARRRGSRKKYPTTRVSLGRTFHADAETEVIGAYAESIPA
jgi:hypothetical protein